MRPVIVFTFLPLLASALQDHGMLFRRDSVSCDPGDKVCGSYCIPSNYTCCPDLQGGCATSTTVCQLGNNGVYGCCPIGDVCTGDGGAEYLDSSNSSSTASSSAASATSTKTSGAEAIYIKDGLVVSAMVVGFLGLLEFL